ncbi:uncharacterized protein E0L32_003043 [Thyridium curvatum]|uniref:Actin binding protein n=1 Tax=Thyridium curvatum TaxID=1093900 RepID=A0A507BKZ9_9PEZI|nr:uncharacterized protein E0L32_003043 [Thyridium curvatum]TPX17400.1 hypothetical protein E0L32_003043 [Thyridium curvatum]
MASLNLSINGPSIKSSYQGVVNATLPSSSSSTFAHWALFTVQAPLMNAFQDSAAKESILKVQDTGEGEIDELIEDFNEGRIQFAYLKVKDPNTGLPKNVLIAWCGGGVPERTKGYFTSHLNAVSKILHGYHVQITARSDTDLEPASIMKKVADASGAKYTAGGAAPMSSAPPPVAKKPVFTPTTSSSAASPLIAARNRRSENVDEDGWGADAPPVTRTQIEKVESAYKPTKVNIAELTGQKQEPSRFNDSRQDDGSSDVVKGAYQPVGKVDIAAIRAAAKDQKDDRPTIVKGAYEPVGKVDIAAIRAKAQKPAAEEREVPQASEPAEQPKSLAERSAAFSQPQSERLTSMPKPKVANKFGGASSFTGTKAPTPGALGFGTPVASAAPPVGSASRTFADQGGKTPAQLWAEKKARQGGAPSPSSAGPAAEPVTAQKSGSEWKSGYQGKSWAPVQTAGYGQGHVVEQRTGEEQPASAEEPASPSSGGGVSALRDRFKDAQPMGQATREMPRAYTGGDDEAPPPPPMGTRPSAPSGGFALPGLPSRPAAEEEEEEEPEIRQREESPPRIAVPVPRIPEPEIEPAEIEPPRALPVRQIAKEIPQEEELPEDQEAHGLARGAATAVAEEHFGHDQVAESHVAPGTGGGKRALVQYDYEKAEDNEIELREGEYVTNIDMVDEDWWIGTNTQGESGLFPSNYVELVDDDEAAPAQPHAAAAAAAVPPPPAPAAAPEPELAAASAGGGGSTATAQFDYEAAEDNELSFPEGAKITNLEFPDEDWWFGHYNGQSGLFPANYVELNH